MTINFAELAKNALPRNFNDWGSERQTVAQDLLFREVRNVLDAETFEWFESYRSTATTDESIAEALRLVEFNVE
jgi:hypothetical protein